MKIFVSDAVSDALQSAALVLRERYLEGGDDVPVGAIVTALVHWLELSIEDLARDAVFHAATGDVSQAINRVVFTRELEISCATQSVPGGDRPSSC